MNLLKVFKGILFLGLLLLANSISAQVVSITPDTDGAEVLAPGAPNTASFTISRDTNPITGTNVDYVVAGTSTSGVDHDLADGTVNLNFLTPGAAVTTIVNILDDDLVEGLETIVITLTSVTGGTINPAADELTIDIEDNDVGVLTLNLDTSINNGFEPEAPEGANPQIGQFRMDSDKRNETGSTVLVTFVVTGTSTPGPGAGAAFDYDFTGAINVANTRITLPTNNQFRNVNVVPWDDSVAEPDKTVTIRLTGTNNPLFTIGASDTATVTIIDDDCAAGTTAPTLNSDPTSLCDVASVNLNTFIDGAAPAGAALRWSTVASPTEAQLLTGASVTAAPAGTYYGLFTAGTGASFCTSPSTELEIVLNTSPTAGANANGSACNNPTTAFGATALDLDTLLAVGVDPGTWAFTSGPQTLNPNVNNVVQFRNRQAGTYVYTYTTNNAVAPCTNDSAVFTITVGDCDPCVAGNSAPVLDPSTSTIACDEFTSSFNDYTNSAPPAGTVLTWSRDSDPLNTAAHLTPTEANNPPLIGATYYGFFYDATNTCASPTLEIALVLNTTPTLSDVTGNERCGTGTVVLTAMTSDNATVNWYTSATGGSSIGMGLNFTTPEVSSTTSFYAEAILNGCASERQEAIATIVQQPSPGIPQNNGNASACSVAANGPTILDLDDLISGEDAGNWVYTSGPFADFNIPSNNILNFEGRPDGEYVFTYTTTGAMAPCMNESTVMTITVNDCDVDTDLDGLFDGTEATLGTDSNNRDTDGDGVDDGDEVGADIENPLDEDDDGTIDALDSNVIDSDMDGVVDQIDPANDNPCIPDNTNGLCDTDEDGITDGQEITDGTDPLDACDPNLDSPFCVDPVPIDLEIKKEVDNLNALFEEEVTFTITVTNLTDSRAKAIKVGELLESGFEYISHNTSIGTYDVQSGEWDIFEIDPLSTHTLTIKVKIVEGGTYSNTAELLESFPMDNSLDNNIATITLPIELPEGIDLVLEKTALSSNPLVNEEVIFTIKVINASIDTNPVNTIEVRDILDADNFEYIDHNTITGEYDEGSGIWSIPSIANGQEVILEIRVRVPNEGKFTNTASIMRSSPIDGNPDNNEATSEVTVSLPTPADVGFLYNQFSPNGDGTNDVLKINRLNNETNQEVEVRYNIQIFNRYGSLVFEGNNKSESEVWDGSWKGKDAPNGTYFYTMNLDIGDGPKIKKGWIQLIR